MKRLIALVAVLICMMMILPLTAFAGDIPESLLYEEGAQLFFGEVLSYHPDKENPDIEVSPVVGIKGNVKEGHEANLQQSESHWWFQGSCRQGLFVHLLWR